MGLKLERKPIQGKIHIIDSFYINTVYRDQTYREGLGERSSVEEYDPRTGQRTSTLDADKWNHNAPGAFIDGWCGCTLSALRKIGVPVSDDQEKGALATETLEKTGKQAQCLKHTAELAREVWRLADAARFRQKIINENLRLAETAELARAAQVKNSDA